MIWNAWTVAALFLAALATIVAIASLGVCAAALRRPRSTPGASGSLEESGNLLALLLGVLGLTRLIAWPQLYLLLESYVPELEPTGVMCAYGVVATHPRLGNGTQVGMVLALFFIGGWFALTRADRQTQRQPFARLRVGLAAVAAALALVQVGLESAFLFAGHSAADVTCCSQFLNTGSPGLGRASFGALRTLTPHRFATGFGLFAVTHSVAILAASRLAHRPTPRRSLAWTRLALAVALPSATLLAWIGSFAPRVLQLPYHHCPYELITRFPVMALAGGATLYGAFALGWAGLLSLLRKRAPTAIDGVEQGLHERAALALATGLLLTAFHVL